MIAYCGPAPQRQIFFCDPFAYIVSLCARKPIAKSARCGSPQLRRSLVRQAPNNK